MAKLKRLLPFIIAIIHSAITIFISTKIIKFDVVIKEDTDLFIITEALVLIALTAFYSLVIKMIKNRKEYKEQIIIFFIYFALQMILLLLVWPGVWRWDDFVIANGAANFELVPWQQILSSIFYIVALQIIPIATGIIIVQSIIISMIVSFVLNRIYKYFKIKKIWVKILCAIPFLLPAVLINDLYPLRLILYSYIMLLTVFLLMEYLINKEKLSKKQVIKLVLLFIVLSTWRSEGIFLCPVGIICLIYLLRKSQITKLVAIISSITIILGTFLITLWNKSYMGGIGNNNYKITATVEIMAPLVREAKNRGEYQDLIEKVDKVVDTNMILENPDKDGIVLYWNGLMRENYTEEDYNEYMNIYSKLCKSYPKIFIKQRINEFLMTSGLIKDKSNTVEDTTSGFDNLEAENPIGEFMKNYGDIEKPINTEFRKKFIRIFEGRTLDNYKKTTILYPVLYNVIAPICILIAFCIYLLKKKKIMLSFILATYLMKSAIVVVTAPSAYFMYYFPEYIAGHVFLVISILMILENKKLKKEKEDKKEIKVKTKTNTKTNKKDWTKTKRRRR